MMKKAENVKEFVERIDATKKVNPKDLSSDQDLTIAIMNLISIEEHLVFSGAKTGKTSFYDLIEDVRETRKKLMMGSVWEHSFFHFFCFLDFFPFLLQLLFIIISGMYGRYHS